MDGCNITGLAFDTVGQNPCIDALRAGGLGRCLQRYRGRGDDLGFRVAAWGLWRGFLGRKVVHEVSRQVDTTAFDHRQHIGRVRPAGDRRARGDFARCIARHVGYDKRMHLGRCRQFCKASAVDPAETFADVVHHRDGCARGQKRGIQRLKIIKRKALGRVWQQG